MLNKYLKVLKLNLTIFPRIDLIFSVNFFILDEVDVRHQHIA